MSNIPRTFPSASPHSSHRSVEAGTTGRLQRMRQGVTGIVGNLLALGALGVGALTFKIPGKMYHVAPAKTQNVQKITLDDLQPNQLLTDVPIELKINTRDGHRTETFTITSDEHNGLVFSFAKGQEWRFAHNPRPTLPQLIEEGVPTNIWTEEESKSMRIRFDHDLMHDDIVLPPNALKQIANRLALAPDSFEGCAITITDKDNTAHQVYLERIDTPEDEEDEWIAQYSR